jgi:hypothetical protein
MDASVTLYEAGTSSTCQNGGGAKAVLELFLAASTECTEGTVDRQLPSFQGHHRVVSEMQVRSQRFMLTLTLLGSTEAVTLRATRPGW